MDELVEKIQRMEAQIGALKDDKFEYESKTKDLEMKLSQSDERIKELEKNFQEQIEELECCIKKEAFKKLKQNVSVLGQQQQQLKKQLMEHLNMAVESMDTKSLEDSSPVPEHIQLSDSDTENNPDRPHSPDQDTVPDSSPVPEHIQLSDSDTENNPDRPHSPDQDTVPDSSPVPEHIQLSDSDTENNPDRPHSPDQDTVPDSSPVPEHIQLSDSDTENNPDRPHSPDQDTVPDPKTKPDTDNVPKSKGDKTNEATDTAPIPKTPKKKDPKTKPDTDNVPKSQGDKTNEATDTAPSPKTQKKRDPKTKPDTDNVPKSQGDKINEATDTAPSPKTPKKKDPKTLPDTDNVPKSQGDKINEATDTAPSPKTPKKKGLTRFLDVMTRKAHRRSNPSKETTDGNKKQLRQMLFKTRVRALHSYVSLGDSYLSFEKGDLLEIHGAQSLSTSSEDWLEATHLKTKKRGLIPSNFVIEDDTWLKRQEWLVEYNCKDLEKRLLLPGNPKGTFLVTEWTADKSSYVLSVRDTDKADGAPSVERYEIHKKDNDQGYFIKPKKTFRSLGDLVSHHQSMSDGLCCTLTTPYPRIPAEVPLSQLEINRDNLHISNQLGVGYFSETVRGTLFDVVDVAVKFRQETMSSKDFYNEAKIMSHLRHERLVQLLAVVSTEEPFYIMTEFMIYGTLQSFLRSERGSSLKLDSLIAMNSQIAEGMAYLERRNVVHRDLRAVNILVGQDFEVKVANFALSRILDHDKFVDRTQDLYLPVKWLAPEAAQEKIFSVKSDVWSFGVLMYEIITLGKEPYPGMSNIEVLEGLVNGWIIDKPIGPMEVTDSYYQVMLKCWHMVPALRPSFAFLHFMFDNYYANDVTNDEPPCACGD